MALEGFRNRLAKLRDRYGEHRVNGLAYVLLIGVASLAVRLLLRVDLEKSALLYVGIPYLIAIAISVLRPAPSAGKWWHEYRDHCLIALVVFFGSSIVLFEGFVCVVMFLPIYFLGVSVVFAVAWYLESRKNRRGTTFVSILPLMILASSIEGTSESLSLERQDHVVVTRVAELSPAKIMQNIATPFDLKRDRNWLISIFPMPYDIEAGSLEPGDIHRVHTRYKRWFVTNTHEGEMQLKIVDVTPTSVRTQFVKDTSFFSNYLETQGTRIRLTEIAPGRTKISLQIDYRRKLDPAWYFGPMQRYGMSEMAGFLIDEVMIREN